MSLWIRGRRWIRLVIVRQKVVVILQQVCLSKGKSLRGTLKAINYLDGQSAICAGLLAWKADAGNKATGLKTEGLKR